MKLQSNEKSLGTDFHKRDTSDERLPGNHGYDGLGHLRSPYCGKVLQGQARGEHEGVDLWWLRAM